jgi:DHA2 family multidrug resistance protein
VLASFLCGVAQSMPELVGFRVLQGVVAGPLYPMTQTLLIAVYPPAKRGMALALLAMVTVVAPIAGPILGGWITDSYSWPWIFFINVPIGLFAAAVVRQQMRARPVVTSRQPMDYIGLLTLIVGVGALQVVLDKGNDLDWFESSFIVIGTLISVVFPGGLHHLGTHRPSPGGQPAAVRAPQLPHRHHRAGGGYRPSSAST